MILPRIPPL